VETFEKDVIGKSSSIKVEINQYDTARVTGLSLEYVKRNILGNTDLLYLKGIVKNNSRSFLTDVDIYAGFFDKDEELISEKETGALPRIIRTKGPKEGRFTVTTAYDPAIVFCRLDISWLGKPEE